MSANCAFSGLRQSFFGEVLDELLRSPHFDSLARLSLSGWISASREGALSSVSIWNGGPCPFRGIVSGADWPIKARSGWERTDLSFRELLTLLLPLSFTLYSESFENFCSSSMAPKRRAGKEVTTSATEGPPPSSVIERPIPVRDFSSWLETAVSLLKPIFSYRNDRTWSVFIRESVFLNFSYFLGRGTKNWTVLV